MYIIKEENHGGLCVTESLGKGVMWLIKNDWLDGDLEYYDHDTETEYRIKDIVKGADENPYKIFGYLIKLMAKDGIESAFEWLEHFGFYFSEIEVA